LWDYPHTDVETMMRKRLLAAQEHIRPPVELPAVGEA
jgi:hypothetical protein